MRHLFGVTTHSLAYVYDFLDSKKVKVGIVAGFLPEREEFVKAFFEKKVLLVAHFGAFKKNLTNLIDYKGVVIVFDTPLRLAEIKECEMLDAKQGLSFVFNLSRKIDWRRVQKILDAKQPQLKITVSAVNHLPYLIDKQREGKFLDKFNFLLYSIANHTTRDSVKSSIVYYLFDPKAKRVDAEKQLGLSKRGIAHKASTELFDYLDGDGAKLRPALKEAIKGKQPPFKKIGRTYGVDPYELRYLRKLRISVGKRRPSATISEIAKGTTTKKSRAKAKLHAATTMPK